MWTHNNVTLSARCAAMLYVCPIQIIITHTHTQEKTVRSLSLAFYRVTLCGAECRRRCVVNISMSLPPTHSINHHQKSCSSAHTCAQHVKIWKKREMHPRCNKTQIIKWRKIWGGAEKFQLANWIFFYCPRKYLNESKEKIDWINDHIQMCLFVLF